MSRLKSKINSGAAINALSLKTNIRSLLRRNLSLLNHQANIGLDAKRRQQLKTDTEEMATGFSFVLSVMVSYMTDEEICDFLDGWKHIITGGSNNDIIHFK